MKTEKLDSTLSQMNGRYFGIERTNGNKINARLRKVTPSFVIVEDRNMGKDVKLSKETISSITIAGETIR
jgi:hypothetical protein